MYKDYEVVYKSNLNEFLVIWIILGVICVCFLVLTFISLSKVYKKANRSGIAPWIPIYNIYLLVEIANLSKGYFWLSLVPIINLYAFYKISMEVAKLFKKKTSFGYGLFLFPFIFYPILAFSDSEYIGINIAAMEGSTTVEDIPIIDDNKQKEITVEENNNIDIASRNINISIGGGIYQKDYVNNLADVDRNKVLNKAEVELEDKRKNAGVFINNQKFDEIANNATILEEKKESNDLFSVPFINAEETKNDVHNISTNTNTNTVTSVNVNPINNSVNTNINAGSTSINKAVNSLQSEYMLCPNCGTRVNNEAKVCFICGQPLK